MKKLLFFLSIIFLVGVAVVVASVLAQQTSTAQNEVVSSGYRGQTFTGVSGDLKSFQVAISDKVFSSSDCVNLYDGTSDVAYYQWVSTTDNFQNFRRLTGATCGNSDWATSGYTLDTGHTYALLLNWSGSKTFYGSTDPDSFSGGQAIDSCCWTGSGTLKDLYFILSDTDGVEVVPSVEMVYPSDGLSNISDNFYWNINVLDAPEPIYDAWVEVMYSKDSNLYSDRISFQVLEGISPYQVEIPKSRMLNGVYTAYARLLYPDIYTLVATSSPVTFGVGVVYTPPTGEEPVVTTCDENSGFFENSLCKMFLYLFSPDPEIYNGFIGLKDEIQTKAPFAYFTLIRSTFESLETSPADLPSLSIPFDLGTGSTDIKILDFENPLVASANIDLVRNALKWMLWLFFAFYLLNRPSAMLTNKGN